jgi:hypothetical protein
VRNTLRPMWWFVFPWVLNCDSSSICKLGILFVSVKYVLVSVKLVCVVVCIPLVLNYDSSSICKLGILFVSVKYVLVSVKLVCVYMKLFKKNECKSKGYLL